jgi:hypothetical protein
MFEKSTAEGLWGMPSQIWTDEHSTAAVSTLH